MNPSLTRATEAVTAAVPRAEQDPLRPVYHFRPPAQWMNDPNGTIFAGGYFHLFYQFNPYDDCWQHMHWGHARSRDLVHWEHLPIALWPSEEAGEEHCFSGCAAVLGDGTPLLLYTSVDGREESQRPNEQWAALGSADWMTWTKYAGNPVLQLPIPGAPAFTGQWRDPYLFTCAGRQFLIVGADTEDETMLPIFEAKDGDLLHWHYRGLLYRIPKTTLPFLECPNFFRVGSHWVLLTSPYQPVHYFVGDFSPTRWSSPHTPVVSLTITRLTMPPIPHRMPTVAASSLPGRAASGRDGDGAAAWRCRV